MCTEPRWVAILFSWAMVQAILADLKTQTRRIVTKHNSTTDGKAWQDLNFDEAWVDGPCLGGEICLKVPNLAGHGFKAGETTHRVYPRVSTGDFLWVRERCWIWGRWVRNGFTATGRQRWRFQQLAELVRYQDDHRMVEFKAEPRGDTGWVSRPSIFMPRWASRITLEVTSVRAQRLKEITAYDIGQEGVCDPTESDEVMIESWRTGWNSINGHREGCSWDDSPLVWIYRFRRITP